MPVLAALVGLVLILGVLWDTFETVVLPRRVARRVRIARAFYGLTWPPWSALARRIADEGRREAFLSYYGPLSLLGLLVVWALTLLVGFALLQWSLGPNVATADGQSDFGTDLYMSGTTLFTLGLGDVTPRSGPARALVVAEVGTGFGFLALVIAYLPVLYQSFSARETNVSLLDGRAGTPPSAAELLRRNLRDGRVDTLERLLYDWERWSADLLETNLSYPALAYYRSQHEKQSWICALTVVLDACALVLTVCDGRLAQQAQFTFAMARHAAGDLSQVFGTEPRQLEPDRLPPAAARRLWDVVYEIGPELPRRPDADQYLGRLRDEYEPYVAALAAYFLSDLPPWLPDENAHDNWEVTAWGILPHVQLPGPGNEPGTGTHASTRA